MQPRSVQRGIIVADDSPVIRDNVRTALGEHWRIFLAEHGAKAVEFARDVNAELVLLDFRMPQLDGLEACAQIRNLPNYASVPIVLLTAYDGTELRRRAAQAGATTVFSKPFTIDVLREAVLPLIALGRDAAAARGGAVLPDRYAEPSPGSLDAARDVLAVYRRVDQAAERRHYGSFAETMAARRMKLLR